MIEQLIASILIGRSPQLRKLRGLIAQIAPTPIPVLIEGPTGTGKELIARALHLSSGRRGEFVPFNVCAIPAALFEATVFGHVRGAFTGAQGDSPGLLREADGGTVLFDEVSGLDPSMQLKLLRVLETGRFRPVGGRRELASDFRSVAAINVALEALIAQGQLRRDFAQRFNGLRLVVPALADRPADIAPLTTHFLTQHSERGGSSAALTAAAIQVLERQPWPGNARQLRQVVTTAAVLARSREIQPSDLLPLLEGQQLPLDIGTPLARRRQRLLAALDESDGNVDAAAQKLGRHRATVYRWIQEFDLDASQSR